MLHLECSNDRRRVTLPILILRPDPPTDFDGYAATALLDTGATASGITPRVVDALGLFSIGKRPLGSARGEEQAERYLCRIGLHATAELSPGMNTLPFTFEPMLVFGLTDAFRFDAILGMDVLSQCDFRMDRRGHTLLSFGI